MRAVAVAIAGVAAAAVLAALLFLDYFAAVARAAVHPAGAGVWLRDRGAR